MRLNLISYASGLGMIAGALLWPTPSQAQGFCYMVDGDGAVTNLDSLCQDNDTPTLSEPQADIAGADEVQPGVGEMQQSPSPTVRSFTITGPPSIPGSSQAPSVVGPTTPQPIVPDAGLGSTAPQPVPTPRVVPTTPQIVPSPRVAPLAPQRTGTDDRLAPAGAAVR